MKKLFPFYRPSLKTTARVFRPLAMLAALPVGAAWAQGPVITSVVPSANACAAARSGAVTVTFQDPLAAIAPVSLQVFSSQRGGRRTGATPAVQSANVVSFAPTPYPFVAGERVQATVSATGAGGAATRKVLQFTAAAGGTGSGTFLPGPDVPVGRGPANVVAGDVDGDGDLDLLAANFNTEVSVLLNGGRGTFSSAPSVTMSGDIRHLALADVDGDGDLDLLAPTYANGSGNLVGVRLNDGSGQFSGSQNVPVDQGPYGVATGDVDGDGDLDLLTANNARGTGTVSVRLNDGTGTFSGSHNVPVGRNPISVAVGDVDNDGDLDLLTANANSQTASVRVNNGAGVFGGGQEVPVVDPFTIAVGDVDADGDLDLVTVGRGEQASVRLNNGTGTFSGSQNVPVGPWSFGLAMGDVDGDGDLDIVSANANGGGPGTASVRLNNGAGIFSGNQEVSTGAITQGVALGDIDGDGDLDLLAANSTTAGTISVRLNGGTAAAAAGSRNATLFSLFPNPASNVVTIAGTEPNAAVEVFDALGRRVAATRADASGAVVLQLPARLPAGIYLVRSGTQSVRLAVE